MFTYARTTYFFHEGKDGYWHGITKDDVRRYRQKMVDYFRELDRKNVPLVWDRSMEKGTPRGMRRGIIYTGSGMGKDLARMTVSLHFLRNVVKSKLPVEIYHYPGEFTNQTAREELTSKYNVEIREISVKKTDGKTWLIKNMAFIESKFTQFVYMDSVSAGSASSAGASGERAWGVCIIRAVDKCPGAALTPGQLPPRGPRGALRVGRVQAVGLGLLGRPEQGPPGQCHLARPRPHLLGRAVARRVGPGHLRQERQQRPQHGRPPPLQPHDGQQRDVRQPGVRRQGHVCESSAAGPAAVALCRCFLAPL
jgi:hypothetical protein